MSYAGICSKTIRLNTGQAAGAANNYFHVHSLFKISNHKAIYYPPPVKDTFYPPYCGKIQDTGNRPPEITSAGAPVTIPARTPFTLTAVASDPDSDVPTYSWEQYDQGATLFRSFVPSIDGSRTFPSLTYILNNANTPPQLVGGLYSGEALPTSSRTLNFYVTVRDNQGGGGGTTVRDTPLQVTVRGDAGPFAVTQPNAAPAPLTGASQTTVTWSVANTNLAPINTANVRIKLSTDGGYNFPYTLIESTPNDGSQAVTLPNVQTSAARIKVEAVGNVYFDISDTNFTINQVSASGALQFGATVFAGAEDGSSAAVTIQRVAGSTGTVSVNFSTSAGTATPGNDYTQVSGTVNFANGETSKTVLVPILNDNPRVFEGNETVNLTLSAPTGGASLGAPTTAVLTIADDERQPVAKINDRSLNEGNTGAAPYTFTVSLNYASTRTITVAYATANGAALSGSDYTAASGTLTFAPGQTSRTLPVNVAGDASVEPDEGFVVNLSSPMNVNVSDGQGAGTILNDDSSAPVTGGALDTTFGAAGRATTAVGVNSSAAALALLPDGKFVVAGYSYNGPTYDFAVARYTAGGLLDNTFGSGGKVLTDFGGTTDLASAVAVQPDGKIVVAGQKSVDGSGFDIVLARYTPAGALDPTFGSGGKVVTDFGGDESITGLALQPDGGIVVAGAGGDFFFPEFTVVRFTAAGAPDTTFGNGGRATAFSGGGGAGAARSVMVQADGKIVAAGLAGHFGANIDFAVVRFNQNGALDPTFGNQGAVTTDFGHLTDIPTAATLQPDGMILVAGYSAPTNMTDAVWALARYTSAGTLDTSFGSDGKVLTDAGDGGDSITSVAVQPNGKIAIAGMTSPGFAVAKYNSNGSLDATFGFGGRVTTSFLGIAERASAVVIQPDAKIVAAGSALNSTNELFALARYMGGPLTQPTVTLTTSATTTVLPVPTSLSLAAAVTDPDKLVTRVDFYAGPTLLASDATAPYQFDWASVPSGAHSLKAVAAGPGGLAVSSASINIKASHLPSAAITTPALNQIIGDVQQTTLAGSASDFEDGQLADSAHVWDSDRAGNLGAGKTLAVNPATLAAGFHKITLTAKDSDDLTSTATTYIYVLKMSAARPIDDTQFFVVQHYLDFLGRAPDASGLAHWTNEIESCGASVQCREVRRVNVSAAFFLSIEFQETGYLAYRAHKAAYGNLHGKPVPITREEMLKDMSVVGNGLVVGADGWAQKLEANKQAYFDHLASSARFTALYSQTMTPEAYVDAMNANAGGALSSGERGELVAGLKNGSKTRAQALRVVTEDADLNEAEKNKAFVLMQFFGYLRRDPDSAPDSDFSGYNFWLGKLNEFNGNFINAEMVKAFLSADEYRNRFRQ
jgi:uncharacterized delta-60 repeat protein